jgi:hypothetical protein
VEGPLLISLSALLKIAAVIVSVSDNAVWSRVGMEVSQKGSTNDIIVAVLFNLVRDCQLYFNRPD